MLRGAQNRLSWGPKPDVGREVIEFQVVAPEPSADSGVVMNNPGESRGNVVLIRQEIQSPQRTSNESPPRTSVGSKATPSLPRDSSLSLLQISDGVQPAASLGFGRWPSPQAITGRRPGHCPGLSNRDADSFQPSRPRSKLPDGPWSFGSTAPGSARGAVLLLPGVRANARTPATRRVATLQRCVEAIGLNPDYSSGLDRSAACCREFIGRHRRFRGCNTDLGDARADDRLYALPSRRLPPCAPGGRDL